MTAVDETDISRVTVSGLERFRHKLGVDLTYTRRTSWNEQASRDSIRHFAFGYGDDNPLWTDPDYAPGTRWGSIVAPPLFLESAGLSPPLPPKVDRAAQQLGKGALARAPMFWTGDRISYFRPVLEGDTIWVRCFYVDVSTEPKVSERSRSAISVRRRVYWNQRAEVIAIWDADFLHRDRIRSSPRGDSTEAAKEPAPDPPPRYSAEELRAIDDLYAAESVRGGIPRYIETTNSGDKLGSRARGPLTVTDMIGWLGGCGRYEVFPFRLGWKNRQRAPGLFSLNSYGAWETSIRVHWDDAFARTVGATRAYDYAMLRSAFALQCITDWMGDDAIITQVEDRLSQFNYVGDVSYLDAYVSDVVTSGPDPEVICKVECKNNTGDLTAEVTATVRLPSKERPRPRYPEAPADEGLLAGMPEPVGGPWSSNESVRAIGVPGG